MGNTSAEPQSGQVEVFVIRLFFPRADLSPLAVMGISA
jgi:hypothetical protein